MFWAGVALLSLSWISSGCHRSGSSPTQRAWELACHAHEKVGPLPPDSGKRGALVVGWIAKNVHDPSLRATFGHVAELGPGTDKGAYLRSAAAAAGVADCPMIDALWKPAGK